MKKNKLTKAQEIRLRSIVGYGTHKDWYIELTKFIVNELSRQREEIIEKLERLPMRNSSEETAILRAINLINNYEKET